MGEVPAVAAASRGCAGMSSGAALLRLVTGGRRLTIQSDLSGDLRFQVEGRDHMLQDRGVVQVLSLASTLLHDPAAIDSCLAYTFEQLRREFERSSWSAPAEPRG